MLLAEPWWVNLLILVPFGVYLAGRKSGLALAAPTLIAAASFAAAFGVVEAAVVVYLRAATGLLPGYGGSLAQVADLSSEMYQAGRLLSELPASLLAVEIAREAATMVMLLSVAFLAVASIRQRCAVFLWAFAIWDIVYYIGLWATIRWPSSLLSPDVLFLIPVPWLSQVWLPILVSALTMLAIVLTRKSAER